MNWLRRSGRHRAVSQRSGYRSVPPTPDGAVSPGPIAAGRFLGRGTEACVLRVATAAGPVEALTLPVMVSPTCICPLVSPAEAMDEGSRQRTKANLHILLLLARDQPSYSATVVCRDGTVLPSIRQGRRGAVKEQQKRGQPGLRVDVAVGKCWRSPALMPEGSRCCCPSGARSTHSIA
jgi:hypothetical protein